MSEAKVPPGWKWQVIGDICNLGRGRVISEAEVRIHPGVYPVYSSQSKDKGIFGYLDTFDFDGEYVTWTTDGAYAGTVFHRRGQFNCTNVCGTLQRNCLELDMCYLAHTLSTRTKKHVSYVGNPKLMNNIMAQIEVPLPPLPEQQKIAEILGSVDENIENTQSLIAKLQDLKKATMQELLTKGVRHTKFKDSPVGKIPEEWEVVRLGELADRSNGVVQTGPFGSQLHAHEYTSVGVPVIMPQDIDIDGVNEDKIARISESRAKILSRHRVKENDVVFARRGDLSRCTVVNRNSTGWICGTGCFLVRISESVLLGQWLSYIYRQDTNQRAIANEAVGSTMVNLNTSILRDILLPLPSLKEQSELVRIFDSISERIRSKQRYLSMLDSAKKALMQDLLTGRVRVKV